MRQFNVLNESIAFKYNSRNDSLVDVKMEYEIDSFKEDGQLVIQFVSDTSIEDDYCGNVLMPVKYVKQFIELLTNWKDDESFSFDGFHTKDAADDYTKDKVNVTIWDGGSKPISGRPKSIYFDWRGDECEFYFSEEQIGQLIEFLEKHSK